MKFLIKVILFSLLTLSFLFPQEEGSAVLNPDECYGILKVETNRDSSIIMINNKQIGTGSASLELKRGKYLVSAVEGRNHWNRFHFSDSVTIDDCGEKLLKYDFTKSVYFETDPQDVYIYNGDSLVGHSPIFLADNFSSLRLTKPGYETKVIEFKDISYGEPVKLYYSGDEKSESFIKQDLFKVLLGGILVLGGTTAYFKLKADNKFEEYQFSGDKAALDLTRRYDLISGISFAALQINFGLIIYYFLIE